MHRALLLLAILELPGALRVTLPDDVCVMINARDEVTVRRRASKEHLLWITPDTNGISEKEGDCSLALITAGSRKYGVGGSCEWVDRVRGAVRIDSNITRPRSDAICGVQPILVFFSSSGGVAPIVRSVTIWSDGEIESETQHGLLTLTEVNEVRRLLTERAFTDSLTGTIRNDGDLASFSIATSGHAAEFYVLPKNVRATLARVDAIIAPHLPIYDHPLKVR